MAKYVALKTGKGGRAVFAGTIYLMNCTAEVVRNCGFYGEKVTLRRLHRKGNRDDESGLWYRSENGRRTQLNFGNELAGVCSDYLTLLDKGLTEQRLVEFLKKHAYRGEEFSAALRECLVPLTAPFGKVGKLESLAGKKKPVSSR